MSEKEEIRHVLKFFYKKGTNATQAAKKICDVYGLDAVSVRVVQIWFKRFQSGKFDINDAPRSGRPITEKVDEIMKKIEQDRHISSHHVAKELNIDHKTVLNHLKKAGYKKKLDVWVPHDLTMKNLMNRISICESLLKRNEIEPFLKRLITGDEKWIMYDNDVRKTSWSKQGLALNKVMLCVWWDCKGIVHYELLPPGQTIDSNLYCQQLERLRQAIEIKRPELINNKGVIFHHDNARPYTSLMTYQKLRELGWEVLMHPPYSPDLAPSDYHLFRSLQNSLNSAKLASKEACENYLSKFFVEKKKKFYNDGIMILPQKWQKVIDQNGMYLV
ncbi:histone-lysine N-methyltransferase SETMAR-like [Vespa mandarinia]|uniref:histone-lysine N-methyltransferase SETMAR-like n=1 Tax=Vespa mandarinia TaxID=7446 RepID=UPI00161A1F67|nr:histone-lysine N-methyltransferase SETMAR-like [Vespa mandarinia]XP_035744178.1 histone-lysine N-methyltransferase SETMAR-like [Vespa mandarinia]XP_035744179.1 histone-lysine N-methyltransferase SETMAR-like [Vespa mandarinia]XP_035744180.1 histone-lysine N-methyltransferase SETMAR-like [Vespa mandarinia]